MNDNFKITVTKGAVIYFARIIKYNLFYTGIIDYILLEKENDA